MAMQSVVRTQSLLLMILVMLWSMAVRAEPLPLLRTETLAGVGITLPDELPELASVFVVSFAKAARGESEAWSRRLRELLPTNKAALYSVSVIEDVPRPLRGMVLRSIRGSVPESLHDCFLVVTDGASHWQRVVGYSKAGMAYVFAVGLDREIVWGAQGPVSDEALRELGERLELSAGDHEEPEQSAGRRAQ